MIIVLYSQTMTPERTVLEKGWENSALLRDALRHTRPSKHIMRKRNTVSVVVNWFSVNVFAMSFSGEHCEFIVEHYFSWRLYTIVQQHLGMFSPSPGATKINDKKNYWSFPRLSHNQQSSKSRKTFIAYGRNCRDGGLKIWIECQYFDPPSRCSVWHLKNNNAQHCTQIWIKTISFLNATGIETKWSCKTPRVLCMVWTLHSRLPRCSGYHILHQWGVVSPNRLR